MGKNGDALRAAKAQRLITFTREQLEAHDQTVRSAYAAQIKKVIEDDFRQKMAENKAAFDEYAKAEWKHREELFGGTHNENLLTVLQLLLAAPSRVLIEHFGFPPVPKRKKIGRNRTADFAELLAEEVSKITQDETRDIRDYCDEVYEKYGVKYILEEAETDGDGKASAI
jgi:hypothetical protein